MPNLPYNIDMFVFDTFITDGTHCQSNSRRAFHSSQNDTIDIYFPVILTRTKINQQLSRKRWKLQYREYRRCPWTTMIAYP